MNKLIEALMELHQQGSLHIMDRGQICVGCGGQWPCRTQQIVWTYAVEALNTTVTPATIPTP